VHEDGDLLSDGEEVHLLVTPAELVHGRQFPIGTLLYSEPKSPRSDEDEEEEDPENLVGIDSDEDTESDGNDDVDGGFIDPDGEDECVWDIHGIDGYPGAKCLVRTEHGIKNQRLTDDDANLITKLSYTKHASLYTDIEDLPGADQWGLTPKSLTNGRTLRWWPLADPGAASRAAEHGLESCGDGKEGAAEHGLVFF
jgi:hypothetical protein